MNVWLMSNYYLQDPISFTGVSFWGNIEFLWGLDSQVVWTAIAKMQLGVEDVGQGAVSPSVCPGQCPGRVRY